MGPEARDDKEVSILGRVVRWTDKGVEYEAGPKHRRLILEHFGFDDSTRGLAVNGEKEDREEEWECVTSGKSIGKTGLERENKQTISLGDVWEEWGCDIKWS